MFEVMVAYYFLWGVATVGPFSTDSQCERTRQWAGRQDFTVNNRHLMPVSECWYGPALAIAKPRDGK